MEYNLTEGKLSRTLARFAVPYLIASFLQTFYGMADLYITGQFNGAASITGVSVGSQLMHMVTVIIVGLAMGSTVLISRSVGAKDRETISRCIGNTITLFLIFAAALTVILSLCVHPIMSALSTPEEAVTETRRYMLICFAGVPFITAYNVLASIFRGLGDSKSPMIFVAIAGILNVGLDYIMIGPLGMGAAGAALATILSQAVSVCLALIALKRQTPKTPSADRGIENSTVGNRKTKNQKNGIEAPASGIHISRSDLRPDSSVMKKILSVGIPIAMQDGFVQIAFLFITAIANSRGLEIAAAVGIVEKIISFFFLVPSAMLSTVSAVVAQNTGAGKYSRSRDTLRLALLFCMLYGVFIFILCQFVSTPLVSLFTKNEPLVVKYGAQYLRSYSSDAFFAGIHFCFSGFFSAYGKAAYSFGHNMASICCARIPGVYLTSKLFPDTLYPMGWATPAGSLLSDIICIFLYVHGRKTWYPD